jgi:hypothetical protein
MSVSKDDGTQEAEIWKIYRFRGYRVMVIQQWRDPFGRKMVRIETTDDAEARAEGMFEDVFMREAVADPAGQSTT